MTEYVVNEKGNVCSVPGFKATGVIAGFKRSGAPDLALVCSDVPATFAGVFTSCTFAAAPVRLCEERVLKSPTLRAVIFNSGNANACTGVQGMENARKTCDLVAKALGISSEEVAVCSTGRIGVQMPMDIIENGVNLAVPSLSADGGDAAAHAIMTTDTVPKTASVTLKFKSGTVTIGAMVKGAGMIDPHLRAPHATMLCLIATDAIMEKGALQEVLNANAKDSFNRITVDGDMSTNDTVLLMANGKSGVAIATGTQEFAEFKSALLAVMQNLAKRMVMDGEGATKFVTVEVVNAATEKDAKLAAEAVANSLLCKTAWFGNDPNWGRIVAALGYSGATFDPDKCDVFFNQTPVVLNGGDSGVPEADLVPIVSQKSFVITCDFHAGTAKYLVWTSDISHEYVKINADYHT